MVALLAGLAGCEGPPAGARITTSPGTVFLNGPMEIGLDGPLDPLSVTASSVRVTDPEGSPLPARRRCARGRLVVELVVTPALLAAPPAQVRVELGGHPAVHALTTLDGRRLERGVRLDFPVRPSLVSEQGAAPRLISVAGRDPAEARSLVVSGGLPLVFDAPLDPASVRPEACPLLPVVEGLTLKPLFPQVSWRCIGSRFEVELVLPAGSGTLRLDLQLFELRGLDGKRPGPNLQVELSAA